MIRVMETYAPLRESLKEWQDFDVAMLHLARALGIMGSEVECVIDAKPVFWSNNECSEMLTAVLDVLTNSGALEFDHEHSRYRWNENYSWEEKGGWRQPK